MAETGYNQGQTAYVNFGRNHDFEDNRNWLKVFPATDTTTNTIFISYRTNAVENVGSIRTLRVKNADGSNMTYLDGQYFTVEFTIDGPTQKYLSVIVNGVEQVGLPVANAMPADAWAPNSVIGGIDSTFRIISGTGALLSALDVDNLSITIIPEPASLGLLLGAGGLLWIRRRRNLRKD
ncbi:MAG: PEP-CTERM sorting domain-containing protein [Kiritimatiellia bacterium]|nr:PEP-CTERM sorting domain-containing protein [Kiritimatiellia bacterium]